MGGSCNTPRAKSTFKKKERERGKAEAAPRENRGEKRKHTGAKSRSRRRVSSQPMLPAGQLDKRPQNHHIMTESPSHGADRLENVWQVCLGFLVVLF